MRIIFTMLFSSRNVYFSRFTKIWRHTLTRKLLSKCKITFCNVFVFALTITTMLIMLLCFFFAYLHERVCFQILVITGLNSLVGFFCILILQSSSVKYRFSSKIWYYLSHNAPWFWWDILIGGFISVVVNWVTLLIHVFP